MPKSSHPRPKFAARQKAVVIAKPQPEPSDGGILGEHGVVIWRSSYFVARSHDGTTGWMYVVHFSQSGMYDLAEESRLIPTDEVVPLASCLGRDFEISYDGDAGGPYSISGTFRVPGSFWNAFHFRSAAVERLSYQIRMPMSLSCCGSGIAKHVFAVPEAIALDCQCIEEMMCRVFDAPQWRHIAGPQSSWFR